MRTVKRAAKPKPPDPAPPADWRQATEDRGKAAFEAATAPEPDPKSTPPPWWESPKGKDSQ